MPRHLKVVHATEYQYSQPVKFGRHRMMLRPRDSHTLRLIDTRLDITPNPLALSWVYDVFGNSVCFAEFGDVQARSLRFVSEIQLAHYETPQPSALLSSNAVTFPITYPADELPDLQSLMTMHRPDADGVTRSWATRIANDGGVQTLAILTTMVERIRTDLRYQRRMAPGTQDPAATLKLKTGSCRDFALLMIEALRSLGFAARFVSGYIYSPGRSEHQGGGATHAWVQVYLPGCGWIEIDPTNGIFGNRDLIKVAVARDHRQASPLSGSFVGPRAAYLGMRVDVGVIEMGDAAQP